jgi:hypothetical protein
VSTPTPRARWTEELGLPRAAVRAIFLLPLVIYLGAHLLLLADPYLFWSLTRKAHWFGSAQVVEDTSDLTPEEREHFEKNAYRYCESWGPNHVAKIGVELAAAVIAFQIFRQARRRGRKSLATLYLIVAIGAAVVAAEEARWGETFGLRLFPEDFAKEIKRTNLQAEMTLHNQPRAQKLIKDAMMVLALYGLLASVIVARWRREWLRERAFYLFIAHPVLTPGFAVVLLYNLERTLHKLFTGERMPPTWTALQEPAELVAVMTLLLFCWLVLRTVKRWPLPDHAG